MSHAPSFSVVWRGAPNILVPLGHAHTLTPNISPPPRFNVETLQYKNIKFQVRWVCVRGVLPFGYAFLPFFLFFGSMV